MPFSSLHEFNKWLKSIQYRFNHASRQPGVTMTTSEETKMLKNRRKVRLNGKRKRLSHVVWHDHTGHWPEWPEVVHHIDGDKTNDAFKNLQLMSAAEHTSLHQTGANQSEETKARMSAARKGGILSEEHRARIRAAAIQRWKDPEYRAKISAANMGENNPSWKGDAATPHSKYTRIQRAKRRAIREL